METICAIATALGGALGVVRISGDKSMEICDRLFKSKGGTLLSDSTPRLARYGTIVDAEGKVLDEVIAITYIAPHSYTGENSVELMCHGSSYILQNILDLLIQNGCRMARPGEYTQRAFLNGKMDLSQAEAVADLISSSTAASHRLAMNQMRGGFSRELRLLRDKLLRLTSLLELELDFSEEDVEFADRNELRALSDEISTTLSHLVDSFRVGNVLKNGLPVAIIGETNVGKSTLLNRLLKDDRAIVSDVHGTTRDSIEDTIMIEGCLFRFIDTAGIRDTSDVVESIGIDRTFQKIDSAEVILWLIDATDIERTFMAIHRRILPHVDNKNLLVVINKCDLLDDTEMYDVYQQLYEESGINPDETVKISAREGQNIKALEEKLLDYSMAGNVSESDVIVTNVRHVEALRQALSAIEAVRTGLQSGVSGDLLAEDLRQCLHSLGEIVGEITNDEVLGSIFEHFCIGK